MDTQVTDTLHLRAPALADLSAVVALMNMVSLAEQGVKRMTEDRLRREWGLPSLSPEQDARLAFTAAGDLVGYIEVWGRGTFIELGVDGCVHPDWQGQGIGAALMDWAEAYGAEVLLPRAPEGAHVALATGTDASNERAARLFRRRGYHIVRHFWRMAGDLDQDSLPDLPDWPDGITIRPYIPKLDDRFVYQVMQDSFRDHWGFHAKPFDEWRHWSTSGEDFDPGLWFLAVTLESGGNEIVGAALCRPDRPEDPDMGWIDTLGVLRDYRQQGIGSALLRYAVGEFHRRGKARVGLMVDAENATGATRIYEQAGLRVTRQWDRYEKVLREET
ncbi:MAG: GNAT family N-acetyltransferase, partial [Anaerolineae bacterium]|nr:GNAT family N-acetyltransferase [Anaerolineae bacterium]